MVLASIRKISGKKKLKKLKIKNASPVPFQKIASVGILYYMDDASNLKHLHKVLKNPFLEGKNVQIICWFKASKKKPHPQIDQVVFIDRTDFDTNYLPTSKKTRRFYEEDFDVLVDLTTEYHFPIHALAVMSNAKLKSGIDAKLNWHLQVKIRPTESKRNNTNYLFEQILQYLEKLF